jgi:hypothetical protein
MRTAPVLTLWLVLGILAPSRTHAQETPTTLTRPEFQCQNAFGRSLVAMSNGTGACLAECRSSPGRRCELFFPDAITADCLSRAQSTAQIPLLRDCAGSDCPECYDGGDCSEYTISAFSQAATLVDEAIAQLYCDDSSSADGLTRAEQQCQRGLSRASGRFVEALLRCFANCEKTVQRGATGFSSCESAFLDTPTFDPRAQRCVDRARATLLTSCEGHCQDPPDCFGFSCPQAAVAVEAQTLGLQPATYCQEPGVCGDGQVTGPEVCDASAPVTGCSPGYQCSGCRECVSICGDGRLVSGEVCDQSAPVTGCDPGYQCFGCSECFPICGDERLVSGEVCDQSAPVSGCPSGQVCESCEFCEIPCGNGVIDPGETCDSSNVGSCPLGEACNATCSACNPTESATEDFPQCSFSDFDVWNFQIAAGQNVVVRVDTTDEAGFELFGSCSNGQSFSAFGNLTCSNSFFAECAGTAFVAGSDANCSVTVEPFFCDQIPVHYRLDVSGTGLELVTDDGQPASPSGAFVDAPERLG